MSSRCPAVAWLTPTRTHHEFYYVMNGKGVMTIDGRTRHLPRDLSTFADKVHSLLHQ